MPSRKAHCYVDKMLFGRSYSKIHRELDKAFKSHGRHHRVLYHNTWSACLIAQKTYPGDFNALLAAQYHIILDEQCSKDPQLRKMLEAAAILKPKRKRRRRRKQQS